MSCDIALQHYRHYTHLHPLGHRTEKSLAQPWSQV
jgi:hypothetical protein